jgi:hypothetical protein
VTIPTEVADAIAAEGATLKALHGLRTPEVDALRAAALDTLFASFERGTKYEEVFATLWVHLALLQARLALAEGVVTRCGWCGGPLPEPAPCKCRFCGGLNQR